MNILLINPSYMNAIPEDVYFSITGYTVPHLGLGYIAAVLEQNGFHVTFIECMAERVSLQQIKETLATTHYELIGISIYDGNRREAFRILEYIRKKSLNSFVCAGGYTATLGYESLLSSMGALDCCILGEGEMTMLELANAIKNKTDFRTVSGIAYRNSLGEICITKKRKLIDDLDKLPFPIRKFYPARGEATILSSRGCMNHCLYCAIHKFYGYNSGCKFRNRSAENIFSEIKHIFCENPDIKKIGFYDDNFLAPTSENRKRIQKLCSFLEQSNYHVNLEITACADDINKNLDLLVQLKAVGLNKVFVGIESFVERQLSYYQKRATVSDNIKAIENLKALELEACIGFIPMDPFVSLSEIKQNFTMLVDLNVNELTGDYAMPFSFSSALIAVSDTLFRKELEEKGMFVANERGYIFVHDEVERFYQALKIWQEILTPVTDKLYLVVVAKEKKYDLYNKLKKEMSALISFDFDYIFHLCDYIKETSDTNIDEFNQPWIQSLQPIKKAFYNAYDELKEDIEKYYAKF